MDKSLREVLEAKLRALVICVTGQCCDPERPYCGFAYIVRDKAGRHYRIGLDRSHPEEKVFLFGEGNCNDSICLRRSDGLPDKVISRILDGVMDLTPRDTELFESFCAGN